MPDPQRLIHTLERAAAAFRATPGRKGRFVELQDVGDIFVAGDLHGHVPNFKRILELAQLDRHPRRHLVVQELVHGPVRYPNGGDQSHRLVDLVAALKCQYPSRVHYLLGNHELSQWTQRAVMKNDEDLNQIYVQGIEAAYGRASSDVYALHEQIFAALPVILRLSERVLLSHSLPNASRLPDWELQQLFDENPGEEAYRLGGCIHAVVWGRDLSEETARLYLQKTDAEVLISGHVPCDDGFQTPNSRQLILDAKGEIACGCLIPGNQPVTLPDLVARIVRLA